LGSFLIGALKIHREFVVLDCVWFFLLYLASEAPDGRLAKSYGSESILLVL